MLKSFSQYINEAEMTPEKSVKVLEKTAKSISNHMRGGGSHTSSRADELYQRYEDHSDFLKQNHRDHWNAYNKKHGKDPGHTTRDLFA
jgi:hypothetical protein